MIGFIIMMLVACGNNDIKENHSIEKEISYTFSEAEHSLSAEAKNILNIEKAAEIGVSYITDVLDVELEGKYIELSYIEYETHLRPYWIGFIADSNEEFLLENSYSFTIDAITGERIDLVSAHGIERIPEWTETEFGELEKDSEEISTLLEIADYYISRHFHETEVIDIEFKSIDAAGFVLFEAKDETGREAEIAVQRRTQRLFSIKTLFNDLDPNYEGEVG